MRLAGLGIDFLKLRMIWMMIMGISLLNSRTFLYFLLINIKCSDCFLLVCIHAYLSLSSFITDHIKRKIRRRPSWGRGIIRKKKNYKKGTEEEEDEPEAEVEAAGPSDSCLTQDEESSCDTMGPQPNGHLPHVPSTEEESSNEPPVTAPAEPSDASEARQEPTPKEEEPTAREAASENTEKHTELRCLADSSQPKADGGSQDKQADVQPLIEMSECSHAEAQPKHTEDLVVSQVNCVNGNESMDSLDSQSLKRSSEPEKVTPQRMAEGANNDAEEEEHKDKNESDPTQEHPPQDGRADKESVEEDQDKEGMEQVFCNSFLAAR